MSRFRAPVRRKGDGFVVDVGRDERDLLLRLTAELRALLTEVEPSDDARVLLDRLFPTVYPDDGELEAEYQRLMRDELVQSKLGALDAVERALAGTGKLDEGGLNAFMQWVNSIRLVLGTMLGVSDDQDGGEVRPGLEDSAEYHLYGYLSWLLEWSVRALSGA